MPYRVGEVSKLSRVSTRALHHYDKIGLLTPSMRTDAGYRLYSDQDLQRLQQILFFKTLSFSLEDIAKALNDPAFDFHQALIEQRQAVRQQNEHLHKVLTLIDNTLDEIQEANTMSTNFAHFSDFDPAIYEEEVQQRWRDTDAYRESSRRTKQYSEADWHRIKQENEDILSTLATLCEQEIDPATPDAIAAVESYRQHIDRWYYPCSRTMHAKLGEMYVSDERFRANFEKIQAGLAEFICAAASANQVAG
jgi:DNA-binding transcriptional MerR regulator